MNIYFLFTLSTVSRFLILNTFEKTLKSIGLTMSPNSKTLFPLWSDTAPFKTAKSVFFLFLISFLKSLCTSNDKLQSPTVYFFFFEIVGFENLNCSDLISLVNFFPSYVFFCLPYESLNLTRSFLSTGVSNSKAH